MQCALYDAERCRSCQWITQPVADQLFAKTADLQNLLADYPVGEWCAPVSGPESAFRNKAKMVVSGSVEKPLLGMLHRDGTPEDLCDCPLYPESFAPVFAALKPFIARAGLTPYNVARKRGELKYLLLTESQQDGGMMLRFVLHSEAKVAQLRAALPWLQAQLPQLSVEAALEALRERYTREDSGLCLLHLNTRWQLATKSQWADCVRRVLDSRRAVPLGPAAMETLTVIAYNQPVSRAFIEQVRGVDSSSSVSGLLEKGLIEEAGRLDLPGRPVSFRTTDTFLRVFGLSSLADLPPVHSDAPADDPTESEG